MDNNNFFTKKGKYFYDPKNNKLTNNNIIKQLKSIYVPPAYSNVKLFLNNKIRVIGTDKMGRKQYLYSNDWKKKSSKKKYCDLLTTCNNKSRLDNFLLRDVNSSSPEKKLIATAILLIDKANFRIGNKKNEKLYNTYGVTTLRKKHIMPHNGTLSIKFIGKKHILNHSVITDTLLKKLIMDLYKRTHHNDYIFHNFNTSISSTDINKYLNKFNMTSKRIRTYNANLLFIDSIKSAINSTAQLSSLNKRKKYLKECLNNVAKHLHNTPGICKSSYIMSDIYNHFLLSESNIRNAKKSNSKDLLLSLIQKYCNNKGNSIKRTTSTRIGNSSRPIKLVKGFASAVSQSIIGNVKSKINNTLRNSLISTSFVDDNKTTKKHTTKHTTRVKKQAKKHKKHTSKQVKKHVGKHITKHIRKPSQKKIKKRINK